jgi:hypothetical protein
MKCCFSGQEVPTEKLLVLYYPPAMAHAEWRKSVYAAARAGQALLQLVHTLKGLYWRYVVGKKALAGLVAGLLGTLVLVSWIQNWFGAGALVRFLQVFSAVVLLGFAFFRLRALVRRLRIWRQTGERTVEEELSAIEKQIAAMPEDPSAEQAAEILRRSCPDVLSELAFQGSYFRAFTYLDFVMYPQLEHPARQEDLPQGHTIYRDAYYVGDIVYDGWRPFQRDQRELVDPRFVGSGGRRGVI